MFSLYKVCYKVRYQLVHFDVARDCFLSFTTVTFFYRSMHVICFVVAFLLQKCHRPFVCDD